MAKDDRQGWSARHWTGRWGCRRSLESKPANSPSERALRIELRSSVMLLTDLLCLRDVAHWLRASPTDQSVC